MKYISLLLIILYSSHSLAEIDSSKIQDLCFKPPGGLYEKTDSSINGKGNLNVNITLLKKLLGDAGVNLDGNYSESKKVIDGVQRVLIEHQAAENSNYRDCVQNIYSLSVNKSKHSQSDKVFNLRNKVEDLQDTLEKREDRDRVINENISKCDQNWKVNNQTRDRLEKLINDLDKTDPNYEFNKKRYLGQIRRGRDGLSNGGCGGELHREKISIEKEIKKINREIERLNFRIDVLNAS